MLTEKDQVWFLCCDQKHVPELAKELEKRIRDLNKKEEEKHVRD